MRKGFGRLGLRKELGRIQFTPAIAHKYPTIRAHSSCAATRLAVESDADEQSFVSREPREQNQLKNVPKPLRSHAIKSAYRDDKKKSIIVEWGNNTTTAFHYFWLRDNCRCPECYHSISYQRQVDTARISHNLQLRRVEVLENEQLCIHWENDGVVETHTSIFSSNWLMSCLNNDLEKCTRKHKRVLWNVETIKSGQAPFPEIDYEEVESGDAGISKWIELIHRYGFALVRNVPKTPEDTRRIIEKISYPQSSMFGDFWDFTVYDKTDSLSHGDTAYTNVCLSPHTDGTYYREPPGLQFFRILSHTGKGGETQLVDGFFVAEKLKKDHNDVYKYLCETPIHFNYKDSKNSVVSAEKVFQFDEDGDIKQIRFNNDDRSPFYLSPDQVDRFYTAIRAILKEIKDPKNMYQFLLTPGDVLVTNNWRVLHGRTEFTGDRRLSGAYIRMQDFISKTRVLDRNLRGNLIV